MDRVASTVGAIATDGVRRAIAVVKLLALTSVVRRVVAHARATGQGGVVRALEARMEVGVLHDGMASNDGAFRHIAMLKVLIWGGESSSRTDDRESKEGAHHEDGDG